jgi:hypothetical protein
LVLKAYVFIVTIDLKYKTKLFFSEGIYMQKDAKIINQERNTTEEREREEVI